MIKHTLFTCNIYIQKKHITQYIFLSKEKLVELKKNNVLKQIMRVEE